VLRPTVSRPIINNHHNDLKCEVSASAEQFSMVDG